VRAKRCNGLGKIRRSAGDVGVGSLHGLWLCEHGEKGEGSGDVELASNRSGRPASEITVAEKVHKRKTF